VVGRALRRTSRTCCEPSRHPRWACRLGRTLRRFALGHSGSASNGAAALVENDRLIRVDRASGYDFDSPFVRGWVIMNALPDVGIHVQATWRAGVDIER
jgi:hypothetical protein